MGNSVVRFALVGMVCLVIDAGLTLLFLSLHLLPEVLALDSASLAKVVGFIAAVTCAYFLHHHYTFEQSGSALRALPMFAYVFVQGLALVINVSVFLGVLHLAGSNAADVVLVGTALASAAASLFNYCMGRWVIFRRAS